MFLKSETERSPIEENEDRKKVIKTTPSEELGSK